MKLTRREWVLAAGAIPLELTAIGALAGQGTPVGGGRGRGAAEPLPPLGPPPTLPDKASFPNIRGTSLNAAASHPKPLGAIDLIKRAMAAEAGEPNGFRPNENRIREAWAKLVNVQPSEVVIIPSTQAGESFVASALGVHDRG
jgi:hypothetical protein